MENEAEHAQSSSQDSVLTLPFELITDILLRLPVETLLRFRSVSKSWLALVSCPQFVKAHLSQSVNNKDYTHHRLMLRVRPDKNVAVCSIGSMLYNESVIEASDLDCPLKDQFQIMGSVNGLICLRIRVDEYLLWNPSIRKYKKVTATAAPSSGPKVYGFGYDELHDDYKLLRMYTTRSIVNDLEVEIYSLKSDSWRRVDDFHAGSRQFGLAKFVNGKLHWVTTDGHPGCNDGDIITLDLADEKWGKLEQPSYGERDYSLNLGVLGGDLSVFHNYESTFADVWVMKEYGVKESWAKIYTIRFSHDLFYQPWSPLFCKSKKGEVLIVYGSRIIIYSPKDDSIRYLKVANLNFHSDVSFYVESLVCPFANEPRTQE